MQHRTPHALILSGLLYYSHYLQVGIEFLNSILPRALSPSLSALGGAAATITIWTVVLILLPWAARLVLAIYGIAEHVRDRSFSWAKHTAKRVLRHLISKL